MLKLKFGVALVEIKGKERNRQFKHSEEMRRYWRQMQKRYRARKKNKLEKEETEE